ncbi:hypothetical protein [Herbidospora mongoliensis]|nr:hypothetical protein [Herbidospora mongoliensis]
MTDLLIRGGNRPWLLAVETDGRRKGLANSIRLMLRRDFLIRVRASEKV